MCKKKIKEKAKITNQKKTKIIDIAVVKYS